MEYFCKDLSIRYLGSANPSHGGKNSDEAGCSSTDSTVWPRVASASSVLEAEAAQRRGAYPDNTSARLVTQ